MQRKKIFNISVSALFVAIIAVLTAFVSVRIGANSGYVHFGDSMIYLAACLLPPPYAIIAAVLGGGFADLFAGAVIWVPATMIVKAFNTIPFIFVYKLKLTKKTDRILNIPTIIAAVISGIITMFGYSIAEIIMFGVEFNAIWALLLLGLIQPIGSAIIFCVVGVMLDRIRFKEKFERQM